MSRDSFLQKHLETCTHCKREVPGGPDLVVNTTRSVVKAYRIDGYRWDRQFMQHWNEIARQEGCSLISIVVTDKKSEKRYGCWPVPGRIIAPYQEELF